MNCRNVEEKLMDLLETGTPTGPVAEHVAACAGCSAQLAELRSTFAALDAWEAPEVSPWFDSKMHARLREEAQRAPEGLLERIWAKFTFSSTYTLKPVIASAMAVVLMIGGGTIGYEHLHNSSAAVPSVAVQDLQRLDNNVTALQDMDQLIDDNSDDAPAVPAS